MKLSFKIYTTIFLISLINTDCLAQINFTRNSNLVILNLAGDTLKNPWAGGFNSVQFSEVDLDLDGIKDLFVFDRTGNRISTFINAGTSNKVTYTYNPEFIQHFPEVHDWVLLRDYNCDGKMDIFTYSSGGMAAYKNTSSSQLEFTLDTALIYSDFNPDGAPNFVNLYISSADIPAIDDIDNDGDLDILTFSITGSYIEYHKNLSMEKNGDCSQLDFQLNNKCWGFIKENASGNSVTLYDTCSFNVNSPERISGGNKHAGSMLFTLDVDANNSKDLVLSDVSFNNFTLLVNQDVTPNLTASSMVSQDSLFPKNNNSTIAIDLNIFPAGFYLDVNNDNIKDLIAAPNCYNGCSNIENTWYYKNNGQDNNPDFSFENNSFLQDGMIEVGEGAHPVFFDYNADGLMDIIVGNYGEHDPSVGPLLYRSSLWLYENMGTTNNPYYQLVNKDYIGISSMNLDLVGSRPTLGLAPTFGDLDGDNDLDLLLGDYNGHIHYFTNTAGVGNPAAFTLVTPDYLNIDVGQEATPFLYDIDKDLLTDLIIGKYNGTFSYYQNKGTASAPLFTLITDSLGKAVTKRQYNHKGSSAPILIDSNGTTILYSGSYNGYIYKFGNIDGNLTGTFSIDSSYNNIWEGINSFVAIKDIGNDGYLDMLVGNYAGGTAFYKGDTTITIPASVSNYGSLEELLIYPNPTNGNLLINVGANNINNAKIEVSSLLGKSILTKEITTIQTTINLSNYANGIYLIKFSNNKGTKTYKVIKE